MSLVWVDFSETMGSQAEAGVIESCSAALGSGQCERAPLSRGETSVEYRAQITVVREGRAYEVRVLAPGRAPTMRTIEFEPTDPLPQQWTALGLVVSSLVRTARSAEAATREQRRSPPSPPTKPSLRTPSSSAPLTLGVASGIVLGSGFGSSLDRFGFFGTAKLGARGLAWSLGASFRYQFRPAEPRATWQSLGVGVGHQWHFGFLSLEIRPEIVGERVHVTATQRDTTESATRWRAGGRVQLTTTLELTEMWEVVGGASAEFLTPRIRWSLAGRELPSQKRWQAHGFIGLGVRWH